MNETQLFLLDWNLYRKTWWHSFWVNGSHEVEANWFFIKNMFFNLKRQKSNKKKMFLGIDFDSVGHIQNTGKKYDSIFTKLKK